MSGRAPRRYMEACRWTSWSSSRRPRRRPSTSIWAPTTRCWPLRPCPRPAGQGRLGPSGRGFRHGLGGRRPRRQAHQGDRQGGARAPTGCISPPTRIARARPSPGTSARCWASARRWKGVDVKRVIFNEITKQRGARRLRPSARPRPRADRRLSGAPRARLPGRLHPLAGAVAQAAGQPLGRPRAVGGAAPDLRARGRDRGLPRARVLDRRGRLRTATGETLDGAADPSRRPQAREVRPADEARRASGRAVEARAFAVARVERKQVRRNPPPPFITSTLQQEASRKLGFGASHTMRIAQQLYEGVDIGGETVGLITYMRTDGVQMSREAIAACRGLIEAEYGADYLPDKPRAVQDQGQERPGSARGDPPDRPVPHAADVAAYLDADQRRLYELIWKRDRGEPDGIRRARPGDGRYRLGQTGKVRAARHRLGRRLRRLPQALPRGPGRPETEGRAASDDDDGDRILPRRSPRRPARPAPRYRPSSTSPSRRRATPRRAWSRSWRSSASAGPRPTPASSRCCRTANYVQLESKRFIPEDRGRLVTAFLVELLRALRRLRLHRRPRGAARRHLRRPDRLAPGAARLLAGLLRTPSTRPRTCASGT